MKKRGLLIAVGVGLLLSGCVERRLKITSDPPGAMVFVSDVEKGRTPVTIPFLWYGDYDVILRLDGHETVKTHARLLPPWYEVPPLDLLSACAPWTYHDQRYVHYKMTKLVLPSDSELINRAEHLRQENLEPVAK